MELLQKALKALYRGKITLYEYRHIELLIDKNGGAFLSSGIYQFFNDNGITPKDEGVGWRVSF